MLLLQDGDRHRLGWRRLHRVATRLCGNVRDIAFTKSSARPDFAPPVRVSDDNWVLDGCPENGPAMAVDEAKRIHVVWPTLVPGATRSERTDARASLRDVDDGRRFTGRQRIPTEGFPRHPQISRCANASSSRGTNREARRGFCPRGSSMARGAPRFVRQQIGDGALNTPLAVTDGTLVAWTSGSVGQTVIPNTPSLRRTPLQVTAIRSPHFRFKRRRKGRTHFK